MLENCRLNLVRPACDPGSTSLAAIVEFDDDISEVLPYLNATLKNCRYYPSGPFLRFTLDGRAVTLHKDHLTMARFEDEAEARRTLESVVKLINDTWARRGEIEPSYKKGAEVTALEVFRQLPRTNCGKCGQPTCLAFAAKLASGELGLEDCSEIAQPLIARQ